DRNVTGVQTCALPISFFDAIAPMVVVSAPLPVARGAEQPFVVEGVDGDDGRDRIEERERCGGEPPRDRRGEGVGGERAGGDDGRSEERRVGKECRWGG